MLPLLRNKISKFITCRAAVTAVEYGLGFALLTGASAAAIMDMDKAIQKSFFCNSPDQQNIASGVCQDVRSDYANMNIENGSQSMIVKTSSGAQALSDGLISMVDINLNVKNKKFDTGIEVKAGETYIIKPKHPDAKIRDGGRNRAQFMDPFNSLNGGLDENGNPLFVSNKGLPVTEGVEHSLAAFAAITKSSLDGQKVTLNKFPQTDFTFANNGEIVITASQDGILQLGIMDTNYSNNTVSNSPNGNYGYIVTRVQ